LRARRTGAAFNQVVEEADQKAHDRQLDWSPAGLPADENVH
jgi:hypothetical protein